MVKNLEIVFVGEGLHNVLVDGEKWAVFHSSRIGRQYVHRLKYPGNTSCVPNVPCVDGKTRYLIKLPKGAKPVDLAERLRFVASHAIAAGALRSPTVRKAETEKARQRSAEATAIHAARRKAKFETKAREAIYRGQVDGDLVSAIVDAMEWAHWQ